MRIAFIGNFEVPFSTESHHAWTWEHMGHEVIRLQENKTTANDVIASCERVDLVQWTHTHGWNIPNADNIRECLTYQKIPSFSYHLDRYFGIGSREADYLKHPSFHLDYFFSTDGGNEGRWKDAGINHYWLLPGVVEYATHMNTPNERIPVLFTGSENYHGEYPWRKYMVESLKKNYGNIFQIRTGIREEPLNTLYSSAIVCVGDHIFASCDKYCSDRLFETVGRGGFIVYPRTKGITENIPGLAVYEPQNIDSLFKQIDYFLDTAHEKERIERRDMAFNYVKQYGTYTNRLQEILKVMNLA